MTTITDNNIIEFYKFLNGDTNLLDIETFVYKQTDLEQQLGKEIYLELINFDFKDKKASADLRQFIFKHIAPEGKFETWKLKLVLNSFLTDVSNIHKYLEKLYHLYCGISQDNGQRKYQYKFLSNLGLNYLYWVDESYLKTNYGDNWKREYQNCFGDFEFFHKQLKPFAIEILDALNDNRIKILNDGTYSITEDLKAKLETEKIYKLKHPDKNIVHFLEKAMDCHTADLYKEFEKNVRAYENFHTIAKSDWSAYVYDFLDSWLDDWSHGWKVHDPIEKDDWVTIAKELRTALQENKNFQPIEFKGKTLSVF